MFARWKLYWDLWSLSTEVERMDTRLIVQLVVAALTSGLAAAGASYGAGDVNWKSILGAFGGAAIAGAIHYARDPKSGA